MRTDSMSKRRHEEGPLYRVVIALVWSILGPHPRSQLLLDWEKGGEETEEVFSRKKWLLYESIVWQEVMLFLRVFNLKNRQGF